MTKLEIETLVIAEAYDFESVRQLTVACEKCGTVIPNATIERLQDEAEFPWICSKCGSVAKLTLAELDIFADSLSWRIPELTQC